MKEVYECYNFLKAGDYKKAIEAGKRAVKKDPNNSDAHLCLGINYYQIGKLNLALKHLKKAESLTSDKRDLMYIYTQLGKIYHEMGYWDDALLYHNKSLSLAKELGDISTQAAVLNNIALMYQYINELDKALDYFEESLRLQTNEKAKSPTYNNIALIYGNKGDYQKAVEYLQKALKLVEWYGDYHGASLVKLNLGDTYRKMKDYEKAEKYILEGLEGVKKVGDKFWEAIGYHYLGLLYRDKGDKKTGKDHLTRAYKLYIGIDATMSALSVLSDIEELEKER
jgi:tetratricopeptide (TPR) repeat protein